MTKPRLRLPVSVRGWFAQTGLTPQPFQRAVWRAYAAGASGLIHAPTGSGKTLAAALGPMLAAAAAKDQAAAPAIRLLWITPLRALSVDTAKQIQEIVDGVGLKWTVGVRTGDTSAAERARQRRKLPSVLITTPESFALLLSYADTAAQLHRISSVVVDEWHELLASKRGVQVQLCLAHLRAQGAVQTWGLSATIGNLDEAKIALLGQGVEGAMIQAQTRRVPHIRTLIPQHPQRFPWAGHLGLTQVPAVIEVIEAAVSTLVFTNTRSQAERWFEAISSSRLDWLGKVALHHGSLAPDVRRRVEALLRAGELKCVVATASLDLGVDFSPVDQVVQIGSAKGVARLLQRAGRSGHHPGGTSDIVCVPTHMLELIEFAAARRALAAGKMEVRSAPTGALDVLVQHLITLALAGGVDPDTVATEARSTDAFANLLAKDWQWVLEFVTLGGPALQSYTEYQRLVWEAGKLFPASQKLARRHRMAIGTIGSDASVRVQFRRGPSLGTIEESFIARLTPGDVFLFGGRALELCNVRDMVATVKSAKRARTLVPRWNGGRLPLSTHLASAFLEELALFECGGASTRSSALPELRAASDMLRLQQLWSQLPTPERLLVELLHTRQGYSLFLFPFAGRQANDAIAALLAWRLSQRSPKTITFTANDYGLELFSQTPFELNAEAIAALLSPVAARADLIEASNLAELAKSRFRDIARIAGLVFQGYPGASKTARQIQASSGLLFDVLSRYDANNALLAQARHEVLSDTFDLPRVDAALQSMAAQQVSLQTPANLTPFAMPLWVDRQGATLTTERWQDRIQAMLGQLEESAAVALERSVR